MTAVLLLCAVLMTAGVLHFLWNKSNVATIFQAQCSSGDSEVMTFSTPLMKSDSLEAKKTKIDDAFAHIAQRRKENHETWIKLRETAIAEKQAAEAAEKGTGSEEPTKLRPITEDEQRIAT